MRSIIGAPAVAVAAWAEAAVDTFTLDKIEFDGVRHILSRFAATGPGRELALRIRPSRNPDTIRHWLRQTGEMVAAVRDIGLPPMAGVTDISPALRRAAPGGGADAEDFAVIAAALAAAGNVRAYLAGMPESLGELHSLAAEIGEFAREVEWIREIIGPSGEVRDDASPRLLELRRGSTLILSTPLADVNSLTIDGGGGNDGTDRHDAADLDGSGDGGGDADGSRRQVVVLTGDDGGAADRFRAHPAIDEVFAGVPPEAKVETVERLRERGTVAMVGDGSNDAPALAAADLGIAMAEGTELAADAADAVVTGELASVPAVFEVTAAAKRRVRQNLGWAFVYNAVAVPLALVGAINPLFAAGAMAASSLLVVANSARSFDVAIPEGIAAGDDGEVGPGTDREPGPGPDDATGAGSSPSQ